MPTCSPVKYYKKSLRRCVYKPCPAGRTRQGAVCLYARPKRRVVRRKAPARRRAPVRRRTAVRRRVGGGSRTKLSAYQNYIKIEVKKAYRAAGARANKKTIFGRVARRWRTMSAAAQARYGRVKRSPVKRRRAPVRRTRRRATPVRRRRPARLYDDMW